MLTREIYGLTPQSKHPKRKDPALEGGISKHISAVAQVEIGTGKMQKLIIFPKLQHLKKS